MPFITLKSARALAVLAGLLWGASSGAAATISAFSAFAAPTSPFTTDLTFHADFFAADASISATITCNAATTCSGEALRYTMAILNVTPPTPIFVELVGNASAPTTGSFAWSAASSTIVSVTNPFTLAGGAFDQSILSTSLPTGEGGTASAPSLFLTMAPGQSITFSMDIFIGAEPVPEPGSVALVGVSLLGIAAIFRRRRNYRATFCLNLLRALPSRGGWRVGCLRRLRGGFWGTACRSGSRAGRCGIWRRILR